jgi:hypothetical protein
MFRACVLESVVASSIPLEMALLCRRKMGVQGRPPLNKPLTETLKAGRMTALAREKGFCNQDSMPYQSFRAACARAVRKAGRIARFMICSIPVPAGW